MLFAVAAASLKFIRRSLMKPCAIIPPKIVSRKNTPAKRARSRGDSIVMPNITPMAPRWLQIKIQPSIQLAERLNRSRAATVLHTAADLPPILIPVLFRVFFITLDQGDVFLFDIG